MVFEIISETDIASFGQVSRSIEYSIQDFIGTLGMAEMGPIFLPALWTPETKRGIIRANNKHIDKLKVSLALVQDINHAPVIIKSVKVSGTLKQAKQYLAS